MNIEEIASEVSSSIILAKQIEPFSKRGLVLSIQEAYDVAKVVVFVSRKFLNQSSETQRSRQSCRVRVNSS